MPRASRPSPLSQNPILSAAERRKSRDDSDLAAMLSSTSITGLDSSSPVILPTARTGLKGRLRRAFSLNAAQTLREEEEENAKANGKKKEKPLADGSGENDADGASMATKKTKKSLRMFNSRFNASTDNISLSSTVSSASVMIRKLGSMGRLARRNSLAGITSLFKDKDKNKEFDADEDDNTIEQDKKGKKSKGKGRKAEASVSLATAEVDRTGDDWSATGMEGLSPAAKLARQHTLKSNAEAAARAKATQEAKTPTSAASAPGAVTGAAIGADGTPVPQTWEKNTTTRHAAGAGAGAGAGAAGVREDGMRVVIEEDDSDEEIMGRRSEDLDIGSASDDDSTWHGHGHEDEEDVTIRLSGEREGADVGSSNMDHDDHDETLNEPWAMNIRRSVERTRVPSKGILKSEWFSEK